MCATETSPRPSDFGSNMVAYPGYEAASACTGTVVRTGAEVV